MSRIANLLLVVVGIIITVLGLAEFRVTVILLGAGLIVVAYVRDHRRVQRAKDKERTDVDRRVAELTQAPWHSHQTLKIHRSALLPIMLLLGGFASAWAIHRGITEAPVRWLWGLGGSLFLALSVIALSRSLARPGKPACELDRNGFASPVHGQIPWREVEGVHLQQVTHRGTTTSILFFRVPRYQQIVSDIHWTERLFALFALGALRRGVVGVQLNGSKENPKTIYAVARFLWKQATGLDYEWNPMMSDDFNETLKRMGEQDRILKNALADPEGELAVLERALASLERDSKNLATMRNNRRG